MLSILFSALQNFIFFALHVENTNVFPKPLTQKQEKEYFKAFKENGDTKARTKLIEHNLRLVAHIIKKYYSKSREQDELISIGTLGLIKAISTFDIDKGSKFATYASRCIENEILMYFRASRKTGGDVYINEPIDIDKDGNCLTLMDIIADERDIIESVELSIHSKQLYEFAEKCLDKRELEIITHRYGLFGHTPETQKEVAKMLGISRSYVSRIENKALSKLRAMYDKNPY